LPLPLPSATARFFIASPRALVSTSFFDESSSCASRADKAAAALRSSAVEEGAWGSAAPGVGG
jgi:hypothetical protein